MQGNSRQIASNQTGIHPDLRKIIARHLGTTYKSPFREFSRQVFEHIRLKVSEYNGPIILDSGCGTGESTVKLARLYPDALVIGVDKSMDRINETPWDTLKKATENYFIVRGDVIDLWRQMSETGMKLHRHFLLYPNPWPKKKHLMRRWHGHPVFPHVLQLGGTLHLRTNWEIYAREFEYTLRAAGCSKTELKLFTTKNPITPFERKYAHSRHTLFELIAQLPAIERKDPQSKAPSCQ